MTIRPRLALGRLLWRLLQPITLGSRCLVLDGDRVLLVRHIHGSRWNLPGGGVKRGETLEEAARREVREECGLQLGRLALFQIYYSHGEGKHDHVAIFVARELSGELRAEPSEIAELGFFPLEELPPDVSPATRRRIEECRAGRPTDRW